MKKILLAISVIILLQCQSNELKMAAPYKLNTSTITAFAAEDPLVGTALTKAKDKLKREEQTHFYVSGIDKKQDSIKIILLHEDLMREIEESRPEGNENSWQVLPPLSAFPGLSKQFIYLVNEDIIVEKAL